MKALRVAGRGALCLALLAAVSFPSSAAAIPSKPEARKKFESGGELYAAERYEEAAAMLKSSWEIEEDLATLFAWAQAERLGGDCKEAVRLYNKFLDAGPPDSAVSAAKDGIVACAEALAAQEEEEQVAKDDEVFLPVDESAQASDDQVEEPSIEPEPDPEPRGDGNKGAWYRDPAGGTLVALGVAGVGVGTGLLVSAQVQENAGADNYGDFDDRVGRIRNFRIAGGVTLGVGGALLIGGVVRWALLGTRGRNDSMAGVSFDGRSAMVTWSGRF